MIVFQITLLFAIIVIEALVIWLLAQQNKRLAKQLEQCQDHACSIKQELHTIEQTHKIDRLTGLFNLRFLDNPPETIQGCIFIDLDWFKEVNDFLGHDIGDRVLIEVGARLNVLGQWVIRTGGDEFVLLFENGDLAFLQRQAQSILELIKTPIVIGDRTINLSASIGVAGDLINGY